MNILSKNIKTISSLLVDEFDLNVPPHSTGDMRSYDEYLLDYGEVVIILDKVEDSKIEKVFNKLPQDVHWEYFASHESMYLIAKNIAHVRELRGAIENCNRMVLLGYGVFNKVLIRPSILRLMAISFMFDASNIWASKRCYHSRLFYIRKDKVRRNIEDIKKWPSGHF